MDADRFAHEFSRSVKFETAVVTTSYAGQSYDTQAGARPFARTETGRVAGPKFRPGDNVVMFTAAEHDQPIIVGGSPYLT